MPPLSDDRATTRRSGDIVMLPAAANKKFFAGALIARDSSGNATPGATATTLFGVGRCREQIDNSAGLAGAANVPIEKGIFNWANSSGDPCTRADIGNNCYMVDDFTVSKSNAGGNTQSIAGKIYDVDAQGVWTDMR